MKYLLYKNILKKFKNVIILLGGFFNYYHYKKKLLYIKSELINPKNWKNFIQIYKLNKQKTDIENIICSLDKINKELYDINELINIAIQTNDNVIISEALQILNRLNKQIDVLELNNLFVKTHDKNNCFIDIQAGSGGIESQDWAQMIMKMYIKWAERKNFKTSIITKSFGEITGIKSATIHIQGIYAFGWLRTESGIHRLVRKSPFNSAGRRHTSFVSTFIYPDVKINSNILLRTQDLKIDVYRASGAGGQHVNRTESAVRITHIPTGLVTQCQNNRSQHKNKQQAIKQIQIKLSKLEYLKKQKEKQEIENTKSNISWGNQIRSYTLDDTRIKDVRTGIETHNIHDVLNGHLDQFIKASLKLGL
ncbi:peptide chain release factor 2 [Enterobacteriaceae endosymbiont of Neohaemonia nigricornis]|uniref:peptide chain release factor 2 n=1 Tax=Enterobacteriaceae endosymbiont of Neohaemonia nigricornis TaxID=2675792 RepID=UPI001B3B1A81